MYTSYFIINKADGYIEESNGDECLMLVSTETNEGTLKKNYGIKLKI